MRPLFALILLVSAPAQAVDLSLSVEVGSNTLAAPHLLQSRTQTDAIGLRATLGLPGRLTAVAAYSFHSAGTNLTPSTGDAVALGFFQNRLELGVQRSLFRAPWIDPVVGLSAIANANQITLDDNTSSRLNPGVVIEKAPSFGLMPFTGVRFHVRRVTAHMNLGYAFETRPSFNMAGSVSGSNVSFRTGLGLRF